MRTLDTDELVKPDMQAVLSRTHLAVELHDFLLPTFEAVSNAMHGIEAQYEQEAKRLGKIHIHFTNPTDPTKFKITVTDNGIGLNDENYKSFKTPFSGYKLKEHGRGFGRFIAFKVFARTVYWSQYAFFTEYKSRSFRFDISQEKEFAYLNDNIDFEFTGVRVEHDQPLTPWHDLIRSLNVEDVADAIGSHFLPYFLYRWLPSITIQFDDAAPEDITSHFNSVFVQSDSGQIDCEVDGSTETLHYSITKIPKTRTFKNHCLLFSAADRIVGAPRDLTNKLGQPHFVDEADKRYIVLAVVRSPAFETRLNDARTGLNIPIKTIEKIVTKISDVIQVNENSQIDKIKRDQTYSLGEALRENPILRIGLKGRSVGEYVASKPNNWSAEEFISDLAIERFRASSDLTRAITKAANNPVDYQNRIQELVSKLDANKKDALAEYVLHRKSVIELVEAARKFKEDTKRAPEDVIHELVFRRFTDNKSLDYFEHNLWLIDDALAFLPYISSDRTMHGGGRKKGDKITDIAFFDDSMVLGDNDGTTITIVEFKKPSRDDYAFGNSKSDPVLQVIDTLDQAVAKGGISKTDGTHFSFAGVIRRFAFIVADHTPSLVKVFQRHDFKNDWNPKIFFRYRDNEQIFIQAFGYDTLVENAKKRNQAFFSVLLGE
ncbi:sensor histidine kinase [Microvirga zambiensis]|uniref:sensor histidine kinase n=1 Tax=Microvirga zambiensis TaxID=1402137 RepID=UPI00191EF66D|nr:sensor histidine kinase [Microvirga zambiensis]